MPSRPSHGRCFLARTSLVACAALLLLTTAAVSHAESSSDTDRAAVVERIGTLLTERYVHADVGAACAAQLASMLQDGTLDDAEDDDAFAEQLTTALQSLSNDKHMLVRTRFIPPPPPASDAADASGASQPEHPIHARMRRTNQQRQQNYGFEQVSRLENNIGYIDLRFFAGHPEAEAAAAAAMNLLAHTDAMIFDMRQNGGGHPHMVRVLCSYLFDEPTHLNSLYWRDGDRTDEYWTIDVPGTVRPSVPVFVLTSDSTFSGAEEFSYNLRTQERATLIGETTRGGANPGTLFPLNETLEIFIPLGMAVNPVTGTNWEGTGVEPHISVDADTALDVALEHALIAAEDFRKSIRKQQQEFDPWHKDARALDDKNENDAAAKLLTSSLRQARSVGMINEGDINQYGYEFLGEERLTLAIAAFELNVELFPASANTHDSLGEAYRAAGRIADAIARYERAVELEPNGPNSDNARAILEELRSNGT